MALHSPGGAAGTGLPVVGGLNNSVLFVNPAGTLAQDNANFNYVIGTGVLTAPTITAATKFLAPDGTAAAPSYAFSGATSTGFFRDASGRIAASVGAAEGPFSLGSVTQFTLRGDGSLNWNVDGNLGGNYAPDLFLFRDAAGVLAQRNSVNAQTFRLYNTFTDASNYERLGLTWSGNVLTMAAQALGTGTQRRIDIVGTPTNDNAAAGAIGELLTATTAANTTSLSTGVTNNATSVNLTAGDWDVWGVVNFTFGATTSITNLSGGVSTTSATLGAQDTFFDYEVAASVPTGGAIAAWVVPMQRVSISTTTTTYLATQATFTVSTIKVGGTIWARRAR